MFIDSHCHLDFPELSTQIERIREDMAAQAVTHALLVGTTLEGFAQVHKLAVTYENFWASVGVHPDNEGVAEPDVATLVARAQLPKVVGIGETGLDYFRLDGRSVAQMQWQRDRFGVHIEAAQRVKKPLIVHTRSAAEDTLALLREHREDGGEASAGGVFHCFTESLDVARAVLDMGFYISFSGILTFRNARDLRDVAAFVPLDRCLIETDSPYLAPTPHRGKCNSPAYVSLVAQEVAKVKNIPVEEVGQVSTENFYRLFRHAKP